MRRIGAVAVLTVAIVTGLFTLEVPPATGQAVRIGSPAPEVATGLWINSEPLSLRQLRGKVVLVEFWTYG